MRLKMRNHQQRPFSRILLVDDDPSVRFSMSEVLDEIGFGVRSADNGLSALSEIERELPNIVLSDLNMPRMSGYELLQVIRRHFPSIHLVAMSGAFSGSEVPSGVVADAFYQKGSGLRCLLKILERFTVPRPLPIRHRTASQLLWILRNGYSASEEPCVAIDCPDCHRTFQQQVGGFLSVIREAHCLHCGNTVYYAIAEPVDQAPQTTVLQSWSRTHGTRP
jgi:CheY-like chemotaxis protein